MSTPRSTPIVSDVRAEYRSDTVRRESEPAPFLEGRDGGIRLDPVEGRDHQRLRHRHDRRPRFGAGRVIVVDAVVPPNTTAEVSLPGAKEGFAVGSGAHRWTVDHVPVQRTISKPSLQTDLAELIDDQEAYAAVIQAVSAVDAGAARTLRKGTQWFPAAASARS